MQLLRVTGYYQFSDTYFAMKYLAFIVSDMKIIQQTHRKLIDEKVLFQFFINIYLYYQSIKYALCKINI